MALKIAAVPFLTREQFIELFITQDENGEVFSDEYYDLIRTNLSSDHQMFWDGLFDFFDGRDIYDSMLFSHEVVTKSSAESRNPYLDKDNYVKLQEKLKRVKINYLCKNLNDLSISFPDEYEVVNLSSIVYYGALNKVENYKRLQSNFKLKDNGITLTYLYHVDERFKNSFSEPEYHFHQFSGQKDGVMIYQKQLIR